MPTTSNFGWTTPADTDLVKDGAAAIRTLGNGIDTSLVDLKGGTTGQILSKASNTDLDYTWINNDQGDLTALTAGVGITITSATGPVPTITNSSTDLITTAGDILYGTAADTVARLGIGTAGQVLTVNTGATAPEWKTPTSSGATLGANTFTADQVINGITAGRGASNLSGNTTFGANALAAITSGTNNVGIGVDTLNAATTGASNIAIGTSAGKLITTGSKNIAIGSNALDSATTSTENVGIGFNALTAATTSAGGWNVAVGSESLVSVTTGYNNVAIGYQAGYSCTGNNNTFIGTNADDLATTGSNNTVIGYDAALATTTASNTITLGNSSITTLRCQVTTITGLSDARDKTNIAESQYGLNLINDLKPVTFEWQIRDEFDSEGNVKTNANNGRKETGFIAQDLLATEKKFNTSEFLKLADDSNPDRLEAAQLKLLPVLVKAIQELSAEVEFLKTQLGK